MEAKSPLPQVVHLERLVPASTHEDGWDRSMKFTANILFEWPGKFFPPTFISTTFCLVCSSYT